MACYHCARNLLKEYTRETIRVFWYIPSIEKPVKKSQSIQGKYKTD